MKVAVLTPLPPVKSGIAHYSATLLPELARRHDVTVVVDQDEVELKSCQWIRLEEFESRAESFDAVICQLGNNPFHHFAWKWARENPSVIVLHEIVLHHLLVESTLARGDDESLIRELRAEYGEAGAAVAEARAAGLHGELANFLLPASGRLAESSRHVIVHNHWAETRLLEAGVTTPISVIQHPFHEPPSFEREEIEAVRREVGWEGAGRIVGAFGFVTDAKRPEVVMNAFARAARADRTLRLVFVGESAPNIELTEIAARLEIPDELWHSTGFVSDREFDLWLNVVDRVVALRYPTAGESSGPIVRAFAVGRPVAVSDYAQFAEFPSTLVARIPFESEVESVARFMEDHAPDLARVGAAQREWLASNATVAHTADGYDAALSSVSKRRTAGSAVSYGIPVYPELEADLIDVRRQSDLTSVSVRLTNKGSGVLECALWGAPAYLLHARCIAADGSHVDTTRALDSDLAEGESTVIELEFRDFHEMEAERVELRHSLSGVPAADRPPFAALEPRR